MRLNRWPAPTVALVAIVLLAVLTTPGRARELLANAPILARWNEPAAQYRLTVAPAPYDALAMADALLPEEATVLLVTPGEDVRHRDYTAFHRALYFLAPRPVWWATPAPGDGTWESRWWQTTPLTVADLLAVAQQREADCVLALDVDLPAGVGTELVRREGWSLWQIDGAPTECLRPATPQPYTVSDAGSELWPFRLVLALAIVFALGWGVVALAGRWGFRSGLPEELALAWTLGAGVLTVLLWWLDRLGLPLVAASNVAAVLAGLVALGTAVWQKPWQQWRLRVQTGRSLVAGWPGNRVVVVLLLALLLFHVLYVLFMSTGRPFTLWDSWVNWGMKARIIFHDGAVTANVYADPSRAVALLDYPLLIPLLEAWLFRWLGVPDDRLVGLLFWLFYLALPALTYGAVRRWGVDGWQALLATVAVATVGYVAGLAASALTDFLLAVLLVAAGIYLVDWLREGRPGTLLVGAIAAGLLPWVKREGLVLLGVLCLAMLLGAAFSFLPGRVRWPGRRVLVAAGAYGLAAALLAGSWWLFAGRYAIANNAFVPMNIQTLQTGLERLPVIAFLLCRELLSLQLGLVWLWVLPVAYLHRRGRGRGTAGQAALHILPLTALLYLGLISLTYLFSDFVPYQQHVLASAFRLGGQVAPLVVIWLAGLLPYTEPEQTTHKQRP